MSGLTQQTVAAFAEWKESADLTPPLPAANYDANDAGRAERFVDLYNRVTRYVPEWEKWLCWSGHHWQGVDDGALNLLAIHHDKSILGERSSQTTQPAQAAQEASTRAGEIEAMPPGQMRRPDRCSHRDLDGPDALSAQWRGDLKTGAFRAAEDMITKRWCWVRARVCGFGSSAELFAGDDELIRFVRNGSATR